MVYLPALPPEHESGYPHFYSQALAPRVRSHDGGFFVPLMQVEAICHFVADYPHLATV